MNDKDFRNSEASKTDKRKQSLYFPESMLQEIKEEAVGSPGTELEFAL